MTSAKRQRDSEIARIADRYVSELAAAHPNLATSLGIPGGEDQLSDYSPDGAEARAAIRERTRADLQAATVESERDRVARDVMLERFDTEAEGEAEGDHLRSLNILASPLQNTRQVFDLMPRESTEDWERIAARLPRVAGALAQYRASLAAGLETGLVVAQRQVAGGVRQCRVWSGAEGGGSFFGGLVSQAEGVSDGLRRSLESGAASADAAYGEMGDWLESTYLPHAEPRDPVGAERYQRAARAFNGITLDLEETYQWGWEEVWRIGDAMRATADQISPGASVAEAVDLLERDDARAIEGEDAFRDWMQQTQDDTMRALNGTHFDLPEPVQRIEAMIAPPGGALAMYYTGPTEDFSRPGRTWYPTGGATRFPLWRELSICHHEGVPGHHLQIGMTRWLGESLTRYQRLLAGTSGYVEGWALYAERLMEELGYVDEPHYRLGLLSSQGLRAARVVLDIGMHLELPIPERESEHGGEIWNPEWALPFLQDRSHFPAQMLASEVDRYLGWPGQAISYKVGEREWLAARASARSASGPDFDLKRFHADALDLGPMGLAQLRDEMGG